VARQGRRRRGSQAARRCTERGTELVGGIDRIFLSKLFFVCVLLSVFCALDWVVIDGLDGVSRGNLGGEPLHAISLAGDLCS
jgi:hypothetical protein